MTSTALRRITALMALPLFLVPLSSAQAGQLTQGAGATTSVHATIDVHVAFPPTQDELDELDEVLQESARMICDVTEGGVLITDYNLASNGYSSAHADMYVYPPDWNNKAVVSPSGPFGFGRFLTAVFGQGPGVWGHEFAHLLLGLKDQYFDQDFNYGCGIGHGVDDVVDRHNNSILQSYTARCYDPTVMNNVAAYSSESCTNDQHCIDNAPGFPKCGATAPLTSELNVPANFESRLGDNNYPGPRQGEMLWLQANVGVNVPQDDWSETSRTIWFVEADGTEAWSYDIYIDARQTATGTYELQARLRDVQGSDKVVLDWQVDGTEVVPTLEVEFDSMAASCRGHASLRPADAVIVDGIPTGTDQVQLIIPASELNAPGATDIILDVTLDGELCMHTNDDAIYIYSATFPDPLPTNSAAAMGGAFVGAKYDANSDPEYLQIEQCDSYAGERFNSVTQLWEASNQWAKVRKEAAKRFANTPCDITKIGELGYCCDAQAGCKDSSHQCIYGACVDPDAVCDPDVDSQCGRHLLGTGSDWEYLRYNLEYNWQRSAPGFAKDLDLSFFMPAGTPNSDPRSPLTDCVTHTATVHHDFDAYDTVALVLDRSKSMDQDQGSRKRIEWAQRAILKWTDHVADGGSVQASLRKFNQDAPPAVFGFKTVLDAVVGGETATEIDSTAIEEYLEDIEPDGSTAIGDAIDAAVAALMAHDDLDPNSSNNNAIFLITDGEQTSGDKDVCDALEDAAKDDVPVYIAPVGSFKEDGFACVEGTGGKLLGAVLDHEIPGALFEMHTDYEGQALSLAYERSAVSGPMGGYPSDRSYTLRVEPNAEALSFLITPDSTYFNTWDLEFTLSGPLGESITEIDASYVTVDPNGYSISVRVPNPSAGDWEMKLSAPNMPSKLEPEVQTLMARVEHPGPRCDARVAQPLIESSTDAVEITAGAVWDYPLAEGVTYTATVRDPAGTTSTVPLTVDEDGLARGSFDGYSTDGIYLVRVNCDVADDAKHAYGEDADGRLTETTTVDSGFERVQTVAFTVDAGLYPDPIGDCDDDGVSDSVEGLGDMDGDGVPDYCDPDTTATRSPTASRACSTGQATASSTSSTSTRTTTASTTASTTTGRTPCRACATPRATSTATASSTASGASPTTTPAAAAWSWTTAGSGRTAATAWTPPASTAWPRSTTTSARR
ncbi:vWA domain-containing protein [Plesiocystis pacifica]|nr:vWA domain-containing protein [Plesiocystis pacifica]